MQNSKIGILIFGYRSTVGVKSLLPQVGISGTVSDGDIEVQLHVRLWWPPAVYQHRTAGACALLPEREQCFRLLSGDPGLNIRVYGALLHCPQVHSAEATSRLIYL